MTMSGQIGGEIFIEIPTTTDLRSTVILGARANSRQGRWGNTRDISILHLCLNHTQHTLSLPPITVKGGQDNQLMKNNAWIDYKPF